MKLEDDRAFSLVIPNKGGKAFIERTLDYLVSLQFAGQIVICDSSDDDARLFVGQCASAYPDLWLDVRQFPASIGLLEKICQTLQSLDSEYVLLHANDDFMLPAEVNRCALELDADGGMSAARGRIALFTIEQSSAASEPSVSLLPYPMRAYLQPDPASRMLEMVEHYSATFYSVHRRRMLLENLRFTDQSTRNIIFFQYLSSALLAMQGRIWCGDRLFYVRQGHARSISAELRRSDYEHWPLLITSKNFSTYYQEFREAICRWAERAPGKPVAELGASIDRAAANGLFERGYCRREIANPQEVAFFARLNDPSSQEHRELQRIIDIAVARPDTY